MAVDTNQVDAVFSAAIEIASDDERAKYLAQACGDDVALRERVEKLLASYAKAGSFLESPVAELDLTAVQSRTISEQAGAVIGPYKLLQQIGEGGMGVVFMAEQEKPVHRMVALKIIKPGMDNRQVIARFEAERQALALMDHPNIARVLDAGTTAAGRPYFVMDLVKGLPITEYCDQQHLPIRDRLELVSEVCHAVQHAHQKGIIHRDLKPSNILVAEYDGEPVPKVIDFGVAKATAQKLTERTMFTEYGQLIGTFEYMSPEQARFNQLDVDTRSDIYSLGVLLYELMTGSTPFERRRLQEAAFDEALRIIREEEPMMPSTRLSASDALPSIAANRHTDPSQLRKAVRGELDWIMMKCLDKDRNRRYETANGLSRDIDRHLHDEAVQACPPSLAYRFKKFIRRNKIAAAFLLLLTAGVAALAVSNVQRNRSERRASMETAKANQISHLLQQLVAAANAETLKGADYARLETVLRELLSKHRTLVGDDHARLSDYVVPLVEILISQGKLEEADKLIDSFPSAANQPGVRIAAAFRGLGEAHAERGEWQQAVKRFAQLMKLNRLDAPDMITLDHGHYATSLVALGDVEGYERYRAAALADFAPTKDRVAAERIMKLALLLPADKSVLQSVKPLLTVATDAFRESGASVSWQSAWACISCGLVKYRLAEYAEAIEWCRRDLAMGPVYNHDPRNATSRVILAMSMHHLRDAQAAVQLSKAREQIDSQFTGEATVVSDGYWFDWLIARILLREADKLIPPNTVPGASPPGSDGFEESLNIERTANLISQLESNLQFNDAWAHNQLAWLLATTPYEKLRDAKKASKLARHAVNLAPDDVGVWNTLGIAEYRAGNWQAAVESLAKSMELSDGGQIYDWFFLAMAHWQLGHKDDAREWYKKAVEWVDQSATQDDELIRFRAEAAQLLMSTFDPDVAAARSAIEREPSRGTHYNKLGAALQQQGKFDEARSAYRKSIELSPNESEAYVSLAKVSTILGNSKEAGAALRKLLEASPKTSHRLDGIASERVLDESSGHEYQRIEVPLTWHDARQCCELLGGHLATVGSEAENDFLYRHFAQDHVCWLGATDAQREGEWEWITGEPWNYRNWFDGEPNNVQGAEHFLVIGSTSPVMVDGIRYGFDFGSEWCDFSATGIFHDVAIAYPVCEWDAPDSKQREVDPTDPPAALNDQP